MSWDPQPAALRDGESADVSTHAARNIDMLRQGVEDGMLDEDEAAEAERRIRDRD